MNSTFHSNPPIQLLGHHLSLKIHATNTTKQTSVTLIFVVCKSYVIRGIFGLIAMYAIFSLEPQT